MKVIFSNFKENCEKIIYWISIFKESFQAYKVFNLA